MTGAVYLVYFVTATFGALFTPSTASSILADEASFRLGFTINLFSIACYVAVTALLYQLFRYVSRANALIAAFLGLMGCAMLAVGSLFQLSPAVVSAGQFSGAFTLQQLHGLAQLLLAMTAQANHIALVFFGLFNLLIGYLIFRSTFLPRMFGALMFCSGVGWLTYLLPPLANPVHGYVDILGFFSEGSLMLWLLVMGVNTERWTELASEASVQRTHGRQGSA